MKLTHVTATFPPYLAGTGNVAYHNARVLAERGHDVTVFTAHYPSRSETVFPSPPFRTARLPSVFRLGNAPFTPQLLARLRGFDIIHLHIPYIFGAELVALAARSFRIPLVLTYHNRLQEVQPFKRALFSLYNLLEPARLRAAVKVCSVSRDHLSSLHPALARSSRVVELPNGVDTRHFQPRDKASTKAALGLAPDVPLALFVGALDQAHRFKNVDGLLRAFARLEVREAQLWIIGDGDLRAGLERLSAELGLSARVRFWGWQTPATLPRFYAAADALALPSSGVESFGLVLIEAFACGTAVVASALPGVRTVVSHGEDGLLTPPGDVGALSAALGSLLSCPGHAAAMGQLGRAKVLRRYDWAMIGERLQALYEEVLS